jgi:dTDP-4-dehydrorhamnose reductase
LELAKAINYFIENPVHGLIHLTNNISISKRVLIEHIIHGFNLKKIRVISKEVEFSDKSIINTRTDFQYLVSDYPKMIE